MPPRGRNGRGQKFQANFVNDESWRLEDDWENEESESESESDEEDDERTADELIEAYKLGLGDDIQIRRPKPPRRKRRPAKQAGWNL